MAEFDYPGPAWGERPRAKPLTELQVKNAKPPKGLTPSGKPRHGKLWDGRGLFLLVYPNGKKAWRFSFIVHFKQQLLSLGTWPEVSLKMARERREELRRQLAEGRNPAAERRKERLASGNTFEAVAREWLEQNKATFSQSTLDKIRWQFDGLLFPELGRLPIASIDPPTILACLRKIEKQDILESAHRAKSRASQIFRYAIATGRATSDPTRDLKGALKPVQSERHAAVTEPGAIGALLRAIDANTVSHTVVRLALKLLPLTFPRNEEFRSARWRDVTLDDPEPTWIIPKPKMKKRGKNRPPHVIPLSRQASAIFNELRPITGIDIHGEPRPEWYVFAGMRNASRPISDGTLGAALAAIGYSSDVQTPHGFRTIASTVLNEMMFDAELIELQLSHMDDDDVRAAYNSAQKLPARRQMMQALADRLDEIKASKQEV